MASIPEGLDWYLKIGSLDQGTKEVTNEREFGGELTSCDRWHRLGKKCWQRIDACATHDKIESIDTGTITESNITLRTWCGFRSGGSRISMESLN